jgi:four helix bundle protein
VAFQALELALDAIHHLVEPLAAIAQRDPDLARQVRRAAASMALNLGEGRRRQGRDRLHLWRVAAGSADEVVTALRVAESFQLVTRAAVAAVLERCDRVLAITYTLTH